MDKRSGYLMDQNVDWNNYEESDQEVSNPTHLQVFKDVLSINFGKYYSK